MKTKTEDEDWEDDIEDDFGTITDDEDIGLQAIQLPSRSCQQASRKLCYVSQNDRAPVYSDKPSSSLVAEVGISIPSTSLVSDGKSMSSVEVVSAFKNAIASQLLSPIWTLCLIPMGVTRASSIKPLKTTPFMACQRMELTFLLLSLDNKSAVMDNVPAYLGSWCSARTNQQRTKLFTPLPCIHRRLRSYLMVDFQDIFMVIFFAEYAPKLRWLDLNTM
ncbi:hypothetical protein C5167_035352 [Papaver somniferum]|uniref:Uncharacterized protein n=1 Tax=Papaver somniferum TaxID=3469 RepID=A0A4Y7KIG0_PAPSO|nr:hypothetical protein C5167_035352 [Papaver somniferum]